MVSKKILQFLNDIKENNNREWFHANKSFYEEYKTAYSKLIQEFLNEMIPLDESLRHLEVKDCSFRIARDIRFSKDKTPYKTHLGIWLSGGTKNTNLPGYYIHIEEGKSFIAGGVWWPDHLDLKKIRKEIAYFYEDLEEIVTEKNFVKEFKSLDIDENNSLKTAPKDFDKNHPAIQYLRLKSFTASQVIDNQLLTDKDFVKKVTKKLILLKPLNDFLTRALTTED
ncbi:TIGR02453 family protein [Flavobacterium sp. NST-5]|uniref:TIGR02453 family protein n=1 Tax=Flavobacterium ichthyis TaxID=2698827 RepID=A0ABW9Z9P2_9FLAO|nr:DUF2461 domain-containing protein [Flavobacterium ichthyis]NBL64504.1 TIGR02453 family protein [Flavobacterium ichthyis]